MTSELKHLIKRDGSIKDFDSQKIVRAIERAGKATCEFGAERAEELTEKFVLPKLLELNVATPHIEDIQDAVEHALFDAGYFKTLRAYIVYREQRAKTRDAKKSWVNVESSINEYLDQVDWRVNANANQGYSLGGLILNVSGKVIANYWLNYIYTPEIGLAPRLPHSRPRHALGLLRGLEPAHALKRRLQRRSGQGRGGRPEAPVVGHGTDRQLPGHDAERMGGRTGLQLL